jgi:kinesin family protein 23
MRFAEMTKEVKVSRAEAVRFDLGLTPGRGKVNADYKAKARDYEASSDSGSQDDMPLPPLQQFPPFPLLQMAGCNDGTTLKGLMEYLDGRITLRETLYSDWQYKQQEVRDMILQLEQDNIDLTKALEEQRSLLTDREKEAKSYEKRMKSLNEKYETLQRSMQSYESDKRQWSVELEKTKNLVDVERQKKLKIKQSLKELTSSERLKWEKECQKRVHEKEIEMQDQVLRRNEKLRQLRDVVEDLQIPKENQIRLSQIISGERSVDCVKGSATPNKVHVAPSNAATPNTVAALAQQYEKKWWKEEKT